MGNIALAMKNGADEIIHSVSTDAPSRRARFLRFLGPGFLVSVGYMDPGNWATDLEGGSRFGFTLLWVILASNLMAILLQTLCVRMGLGGGMDLAQACRSVFNKPLAVLLWILAEIAMIATDVAEVIGSAVALNLLFGLNKVAGVVITGLDVLLLLGLMKFGFRKLEALVIVLVGTITVCLFINVFKSSPEWGSVASSLIPREKPNGDALRIAIGIIGATVMPHNLYLHSSIVQSRQVPEGRKHEAIKAATWDTIIALGAAFFVNAAILVLAAAVFHKGGETVASLEKAHELLIPTLGPAAAVLFAVALLASGQSSTITGTLAGQVVMEGFMSWKIKPAYRRMITRGIALIPAILIVTLTEGKDIDGLVLSQVILSLQLPFAVFPLVMIAASKASLGEYAAPRWMTVLGILIGSVITLLNVNFMADKFGWPIILGGAIAVLGFVYWAQFVYRAKDDVVAS
jgi:manganese transport protein